MAEEIERKFLVASDAWRSLGEPVSLRQGYLAKDPERTVRVRVAGKKAWLTIKGMSRGASRREYEYQIPVEDAEEMLEQLCFRPCLEKQRTRIPLGGVVWEVDEFSGENAGLIVAEVELSSPDQVIDLPEWVSVEVTGDPRYYNSALLQNPYSHWGQTV